MLWRVTLAVAAVCVGGVCSGVRADVMSRMIVPRDYGVKLCGREFIRAVIFTCGGSRWKRSTEGELDLLQWSSLGDVPADDRQRAAEFRQNQSTLPADSSYSLADLLTLYRATSDRQQPSLGDLDPPGGSVVLGGQETRDAASWFGSSKKKRNFSLGVAGMCCNEGCTKNDIGRLC
uniref:Relaxin 1 n=1 Tax=Nothobranchius kadleci TaxID=1051664 RepID=A0A1A8CDY3_NOTKA